MTSTDQAFDRQKRRILIGMVVAVVANAIFDVVVKLPYDQLGFAIFATTGVAAFFAFAWVLVDTKQRDVRLGAWGPAVMFLTKVALPAYFVISRGWRGGLVATLKVLLIATVLLGLYVVTAETTAYLLTLSAG